jgi:hypothetical protein
MSPLRYPGGKSWLVCDADGHIASLWQVVLGPDAYRLINHCPEAAPPRGGARDRLAAAPKSSVDVAFQTLLRNRLARGGVLAARTGLLRRGERDRGLFSRWYPQTLADRIARIHAMRDRLRFIHGDCTALLQEHADRPDVLAFIDPPYAVDHHGPAHRLYRHYALDHRALLTVAAAVVGGFTLDPPGLSGGPRARVRAWPRRASAFRWSRRTTVRPKSCSSDETCVGWRWPLLVAEHRVITPRMDGAMTEPYRLAGTTGWCGR